MSVLVVGAAIGAGAVAAVLRWGVGVAFANARFPWAVLVVNIVGSAIGGALVGLAADDATRLILLSGFCGGLTTFSTLSVETIQLVQERRTGTAALSMGLNLVLGIGAAAAGWAVTAMIVGASG